MTDQPPAPAAAPARLAAPRVPLEINLVCLVLIGLIVLASLAGVAIGVAPQTVTVIAGGPVMALFAIINRGPAP